MGKTISRTEPTLGDFMNAHSEVESDDISFDSNYEIQPSFSTNSVFGFSGRMSLANFWQLYLIYGLCIPLIVTSLCFKFYSVVEPNIWFFYGMFILYITAFGVGLYLRRFKDLGLSLYWLFLACVPLINAFFFMYLAAVPGKPESNQFGLPNKPFSRRGYIFMVSSWVAVVLGMILLGEKIMIFLV